MKRIIVILTLIIGVLGYGQKKLSIYNYCQYSVKVNKIYTKPAIGNYPIFYNNSGDIGFQPGNSYQLENLGSLTKFPFYSTIAPACLNPVISWARKTTATGAPAIFSNLNAWNSNMSITQEFSYIQTGLLQIAYIGPAYPFPIIDSFYNIKIEYDRIYYTPTNYEDVIVFFDI
jgi:hypothetical protein